ncbi:replication protein P [Sodalis sp. dw_96]|uniref:replication protein P n=1 Tax=Sodalis sp. dw_96 TaxID=2719794 RepID=UPI001BD21420|nr:replication protein P [Sodalis sp. dw_96]
MKTLQQAIHERDSGALQSMMPADNPPVSSLDAVDLFNELFRQLRAVMPAIDATISDQAQLNELRRQWTQAFRENGIRTIAQINAGMAMARQQEKPFLPSPGQFIAWCKVGALKQAGLPDDEGLVTMVLVYARKRSQYETAESYSWTSHAAYWMVTRLYDGMRSGNWSVLELRREARRELNLMARRIEVGEIIPAPVAQLPLSTSGPPLSKEKGLDKIAEIRKKFNLRQGN